MRKAFGMFVGIILFPMVAYANDSLICSDIEHIEKCIPFDEQGVIEASDITRYPMTDDVELISAHNSELSGAYNPYSLIYLLHKKDKTLKMLDPNTFVHLGVDTKHRILTSYNKGRGLADIGSIEFYKLDITKEKLTLLATFTTKSEGAEPAQYYDEHRYKDKPCGYMLRAKHYTKKQGFDLPFIEQLSLSDICL